MRTIGASPHVGAFHDAISAPRLEKFPNKFEGEDAPYMTIDLYKWPGSSAVKEERRSSYEEDEGALLSTTGRYRQGSVASTRTSRWPDRVKSRPPQGWGLYERVSVDKCPKCPICRAPMNMNGKTSSRTPRWCCRNCSLSTVLKRPDVTRHHDLEAFINYATGKASQAERDGTFTGRSFRQRTSWCWQVLPPPPIMDGVTHDQVFIDGIFLSHSWVILIATDGRTPLNWITAGRENAAAHTQLLSPLPPPDIITADGAGGALAVIRTLWGPDQPVQRYLVHVHCNNTVDLTHNLHTPAGKALKGLSHPLSCVTTMDEAAHRVSLLATFHTEYAHYLKEHTYASQDPEKAAATGKRWWYTYERDRRVYYRLERLLKNRQLFTFLIDPGRPNLTPATNPTESLSAQIRALSRAHAGWNVTRQITAIHWFPAHYQHPINTAIMLAEWDKHAKQPHTIIPTTHKQ